MARGSKDDDAKNWTMGDMSRDQAEVNSVSEPEWIVLAQDAMTPTQYQKNIEALRRNAAKNGKVVGVQEHKDRRGNVTGYTVSIEQKNPKYRGGRKGAGKRKFK